MSGPTITGATRVIDRYGAGVYRFPNDRGLSVAASRDGNGRADGTWDAVEVVWRDGSRDNFVVTHDDRGLMDVSLGIDDDALADLALDVRRKDKP